MLTLKTKLILAGAAVVLVLLSIGGFKVYSAHQAARVASEAAVAAKVQALEAAATNEANQHQAKIDLLAQQRDAAMKLAQTAEQKAAASAQKLAEEQAKPMPSDLTAELAETKTQRDLAVGALVDEQTAHQGTKQVLQLTTQENVELHQENASLRSGLQGQLKLTAVAQDKLDATEKSLRRWRLYALGLSAADVGGIAVKVGFRW